MPRYDYHCRGNGATVEVSHGMNERLHTWGEVCERAEMDHGNTSVDTPVEKLISGGYVMTSRRSGSSAAENCTKNSCAGCNGCG